ncbi:MAG: hypothetical protein AAFV53_25070 [Myxococcota bacterium]
MRHLIVLLSVLVACDDETETETEETIELADYSAPGADTPGTFDERITGSTGVALKIQVWFPTETAGDVVLYDGLLAGEAVDDARPLCDSPRPVLVFSHGNGGFRWQTAFLMEHLASHGWVVAAPDHTFNTFLDGDSEQFLDVILRRPVDLQDTYDWLVAQSAASDSPLAGCIDEADGYAVSGHSFGGYTAYATAGADIIDPYTEAVDNLGDPRVWAAIPLAPWDAGGTIDGGNAAIAVPVMTIGGTLDETTPWSMVSGLHADVTVTPRYLAEMTTSGHYTYAPVACQIYADGDGCGDSFLDLDIAAEIVNTATLSFLESIRLSPEAIDQLPAASDELIWTQE